VFIYYLYVMLDWKSQVVNLLRDLKKHNTILVVSLDGMFLLIINKIEINFYLYTTLITTN
jgi:hypothetical protein